jgi:hypothetical protein
MGEVGRTGLLTFAGQVTEAYTSKLEWPDAYNVYDEMRRRDPTIRTMWNALIMLARTATWYFEPDSEADEDKRAAEFLNSCIADMSHTIEDAIEDALTCVMFGWSWLEICYKRRDDGLIGWRKWAVRRQSSFHEWDFDDTGGVHALIQAPAPTYELIPIPIQKSLHFTFQRDGGNPEGMSLLESLYETWYYIKNLQIINGIGWSRSFVGLPKFEFEEKPSPEDLAKVDEIGQGLTVDAKQYVSLPPGVRMDLVTAQNSGADALLQTIQYYRLLMLQTMLADFINLGTGQTGSWALGSDKSQLYLMATDGTLDRLANVGNRFGVPRLLEFNPQIAGSASLTHTPVEKPALGQLGNWLQQVAQLITWTEEDENWIRKRTGMPTRKGDGVEDQEQDEDQDPESDEEELAELAEFAEWDGRDEDRAAIEADLSDDVERFLAEQLGRVRSEMERSPQNNVGEDDGFWEAETQTFRQRFLGQLQQIVNGLVDIAIDDVTAQLGGGADWAGVNADAARWAREYVGELITGITETTRASVREDVAAWIETGARLDDLIDALAPTFGRRRADLIASTEVTRAFDEANDLVRQSVGLPRAEKKAPAHPRCRCATRPQLLPNGEWCVVWYTVRGDRVCKQPLNTPWGGVNGCRDLHKMIVSENYGGRMLSDVRAELRG